MQCIFQLRYVRAGQYRQGAYDSFLRGKAGDERGGYTPVGKTDGNEKTAYEAPYGRKQTGRGSGAGVSRARDIV